MTKIENYGNGLFILLLIFLWTLYGSTSISLWKWNYKKIMHLSEGGINIIDKQTYAKY